MNSSYSSKLSNPFKNLEPKKTKLAFTGEIALGSNTLTKAYNIQTEKSEQTKECSKLKLNLDIFNTINPIPKAFNERIVLEKRNSEQAQTQPVFQNKLNIRSNNNITPNEKTAKFFEEQPTTFFEEKKNNGVDIKAKNLAGEINILDKILLTKESNYNHKNTGNLAINLNFEGNYLNRLRETPNTSNMPVLGGQNKNKFAEIKTEKNGVDDYLQMKLNAGSTAKARKILPSQENNKTKTNEQNNNKKDAAFKIEKIDINDQKCNKKEAVLKTEKNNNNEPNSIKKETALKIEKNIINEQNSNKKEALKIEKNNIIGQNSNKKEALKIEKNTILKPNQITAIKINNNTKIEEKNIDDNEEKLYECTEGCGRKFNAKALEIHAKICKKVFQTKAKKPENEEKKKPELSNKKENNAKKGKWQKQSEAFRAVVKAAKNQFGDDEEKEKNEKKADKKKTKK